MSAVDQTLEQIVRGWGASGVASVSVRSTPNGAVINVHPKNSGAAPVALWVADDASTVSFSVGEGLWFDAAVPLRAEVVHRLLDTIAAGHVNEYVRRLFGRVIARRGVVGESSQSQLTYAEINPMSIIPGMKWHRLEWRPYAASE